jgi:hypothetical protein
MMIYLTFQSNTIAPVRFSPEWPENTMNEITITLQQLRGLIGQRVRHQGAEYHIIEVLEDGPSIVLHSDESPRIIQANQYGEASRRVPRTVTIAVLTPDKSGLSDAFLALDLL